ncbi:hypothetical protein [Paraburkholderia sp. SG-MS1]|uniref:hypothetical protein n=1 Tax=Paraburkholderia sp. SG-MS1 TaxID=2023741 RepID=UPI0014454B61|nr:hypothetical protein [Paraburkholderia sp. SG-MS1]
MTGYAPWCPGRNDGIILTASPITGAPPAHAELAAICVRRGLDLARMTALAISQCRFGSTWAKRIGQQKGSIDPWKRTMEWLEPWWSRTTWTRIAATDLRVNFNWKSDPVTTWSDWRLESLDAAKVTTHCSKNWMGAAGSRSFTLHGQRQGNDHIAKHQVLFEHS